MHTIDGTQLHLSDVEIPTMHHTARNDIKIPTIGGSKYTHALSHLNASLRTLRTDHVPHALHPDCQLASAASDAPVRSADVQTVRAKLLPTLLSRHHVVRQAPPQDALP